jgi:tetratricopeptide (TPR) repeat protein
MKKVRTLLAFLASVITPIALWPQTGPAPVILSASGGAGFALSQQDAAIFNTGLTALLECSIPFRSKPRLAASPGLSYAILSPKKSGPDLSALSLMEAHVGAEAGLEFFDKLSVSAFADGGYYFASMAGDTAMNPYVDGGLAFGYRLSGPIYGRLAGSYRNYLGLYSEVSVKAGVSFALGGTSAPAVPKEPRPKPLVAATPAIAAGGDGIKIASTELKPVFPIFYKYYDKNSLGSVKLVNQSKAKAQNIVVELFVKQYMDNPKTSGAPFELEPGAERTVELAALFNDSILSVSEGTKVSATVTVKWEAAARQQSQQVIQTLTVYNRNALTWDDDRRVAAFVTAKDPEILRFGRNIIGALSDTKRFNLSQGLLVGMAMHEALAEYRIQYIKDPSTAYELKSKDAEAVDYVQFPRQTLDYRGGDCDDLSALYCSLIQAVGIGAAFITVPGHIYVAVDLGMAPDEARKRFNKYDNLILTADKSWLPIEVTMVESGFLKAWEQGAKEWRESESKGLAKLYPVEEAWRVYEPVGFTSEKVSVEPPSQARVRTACLDEIGRYVDQQIYLQVAQLRSAIAKQGDPAMINKLGALYAGYGVYDKAKEQFLQAIAKGDFAPALVNLGNLAYLDKDYKSAQSFFRRAYAKDPDNPKVLLALARADHEMENYGSSKELYDKLKTVDSRLAEQCAYLDLRGTESARAADATGVKDTVVWSE